MMRRWQIIDHIRRWSIIVCFVGFLSLPLLQKQFHWAPSYQLQEKRELHRRPTWPVTSEDWALFPRRYEAYFNDTLGFRGWLTFAYNYIMLDVLKTAPVDKIIVGKDDWLFFAGGPSMRTYQRINVWSPARQNLCRTYLALLKEYLDEQGIVACFIIAPNKSTVYSEYMPRSIRRNPGPSHIDVFSICAGRSASLWLMPEMCFGRRSSMARCIRNMIRTGMEKVLPCLCSSLSLYYKNAFPGFHRMILRKLGGEKRDECGIFH